MPPAIDPHIPRLVNTASAGTILGVSREYVTRLTKDGRLPCRRVGVRGGRHQFTVIREDLVRELASNGIPRDKPGKEQLDKAIPPLMRPSEVAEKLGVSRGTVTNLWQDGVLLGYPVPGADLATLDVVMFQTKVVAEFARKHTVTKAVLVLP